jgi:hypothetical protein
VMWKPDPREEAGVCPAIVTRVGDGSLGLSVVVDGSTTLFARDGVKHRDDPGWTPESGDAGCWWFHADDAEDTQAFDELTGAIEAQGRTLQALAERVDSLRGAWDV